MRRREVRFCETCGEFVSARNARVCETCGAPVSAVVSARKPKSPPAFCACGAPLRHVYQSDVYRTTCPECVNVALWATWLRDVRSGVRS